MTLLALEKLNFPFPLHQKSSQKNLRSKITYQKPEANIPPQNFFLHPYGGYKLPFNGVL